MVSTTEHSYRAFLSYSHRDRKWGKWLHTSLENYRVPKALVGRDTPVGTVPKTLRPIFRDRWDLSAGHSLHQKIATALSASKFLVVLCSPSSAQSPYVNEEIRQFKANGGADRILALIIDGEPGDPERECFPPALRFRVDEFGVISDQPEEPVAADARPHADGKPLAKLKLIGGLIGVELDDLRKREDIARRKRQTMRNGIIGVLLVLLAATSGSLVYGYQQLTQREILLDRTIGFAYGIVREAISLSKEIRVPVSTTLRFLSRAEATLNGILEDGADTPLLRYRKALMSIAFANSFKQLDRRQEQQERLLDARKILEKLVASDPNKDEWAWALTRTQCGLADPLAYGGLFKRALAELKQCKIARARLVAKRPDNLRWRQGLAEASAGLAYSSQLINSSRTAHSASDQNVEHTKRLIQADPENVDLQLNLASHYRSRGFAWSQQQKHDEALAEVKKGHAIVERLAKANPNGKFIKAALVQSYKSIGAALQVSGKTDLAVNNFEQAQKVLSILISNDPENADWKGDLAETHYRLGELHDVARKPDEALVNLSQAIVIYEQLISVNQKNVLWIAALQATRTKLASRMRKDGKAKEALRLLDKATELLTRLKIDLNSVVLQDQFARAYQDMGHEYHLLAAYRKSYQSYDAAVRIGEQIVKGNPGGSKHQYNLANSMAGAAYALWHAGDARRALALHQKSMQLYKVLVKEDSNDIQRIASLAGSYGRRAGWYSDKKDFAAAIQDYEHSKVLREKLVAVDPSNSNWKRQLSATLHLMGNINEKNGNQSVALKHYRASIDLAELVLSTSRSDSALREQLVVGYRQTGKIHEEAKKQDLALKAYSKSLTTAQLLLEAEPEKDGRIIEVMYAHHLVGMALQSVGKHEQARDSFRTRHELALRRSSEAKNNLSKLYDVVVARGAIGENFLLDKRPADAVPYLEQSTSDARRVAQEHPKNEKWIWLWLNGSGSLAEAYRDNGNTRRAKLYNEERIAILAEHQAADRIDAEWQRKTTAWFVKLGNKFLSEKQPGLALQCYKHARKAIDDLIAAHPDEKKWVRRSLSIYGVAGEILHDLGMYESAIENFLSLNQKIEVLLDGQEQKQYAFLAIRLHSEEAIAKAYKKLKQPEKALAAYRRAIVVDFTGAPSSITSEAFQLQQWRLRHAAGTIEQETGAGNAAARNFQGAADVAEDLLRKRTNWKRVETALVQSLSRLGVVHSANGFDEEAIKVFSKALKHARRLPGGFLYSASSRMYAHNLLYARAQAYKRSKNLKAALKDVSEALLANPKWPVALRLRALINLDMGREKDALKDLDKAIALDSNSANAYNIRAWTYLKLGELEPGLSDVEHALKINPNAAAFLDTRGHIYEALGRMEDAIADFKKALKIDPTIEESRAALSRIKAKN